MENLFSIYNPTLTNFTFGQGSNYNAQIAGTFGKLFSFGERLKFEARGEVFNLFNRSNLIGVQGDLSQGTFGKATSQLPARSLQLHLRATF
jgi:hypothetical protein